MTSRKTFLLRIAPDLFRELEAWAQQEFRSTNGQIEYLLREAAGRRGRVESEDQAPPERESEES